MIIEAKQNFVVQQRNAQASALANALQDLLSKGSGKILEKATRNPCSHLQWRAQLEMKLSQQCGKVSWSSCFVRNCKLQQVQMFWRSKSIFDFAEFQWKYVSGVCTDGALAMRESRSGFQRKFKNFFLK